VARNALLGFALLAATITVGGCSGKADEAQAAEAQLAALRAHTDSLRKEHIQAQPVASDSSAPGDSAAPAATNSATADSASLAATPAATNAHADSVAASEAEAALADSVQKAREIEVMRETFAYGGGTRDPFSSLINSSKDGPEIADLDLVGVYQDLRSPSNSVVVLREKVSSKRHKMRVGDQLSRAKLVQIRARDAVFMIQDFGFERQETLSLRKPEVDTP
jgi:type II secretory pathway pseudopilin PulG